MVSATTISEPCECWKNYPAPDDHIVQIDADSRLVEGLSHRRDSTEARLRQLFHNVENSGCRRIILYVHGGRVSLNEATSTARRLLPWIGKDEKNAYPIFLCWDSEQLSSYFRHLAYERNGVSYRGSYAATTAALGSPLVLAADVGRGFSRLPINTTLSVGKLLQNADTIFGQHTQLFPGKRKYEEQLRLFLPPGTDVHDAIRNGEVSTIASPNPDNWSMALGKDAPHYTLKSFLRFPVHEVLTLPFQFTTEPVLDTVGTPAWDNMVRRTRSMFHLATNYVSQPQPSRNRSTFHLVANYVSQPPPSTEYVDAGGTQFFRQLSNFVSHSNLELEIYAHSMGSIVINEAYARFPNLRAKKIIFMAAACGIREFSNTTGKYIEKHNIPFYNLSLHPRAELDDTEALGLPVRGSLLVWIDEFFEGPKSFGDRTLGSFENIIIAQDFLPKTAPIYLKAFPCEDGTKTHEPRKRYRGPQRHGEFANYHFWQEQFRSTAEPNDYYARIPK